MNDYTIIRKLSNVQHLLNDIINECFENDLPEEGEEYIQMKLAVIEAMKRVG